MRVHARALELRLSLPGKALGVHRGSPRHASRWLTRGEPARPSRSTPSARPDGEESLLLALHTFATAAPSRNPLAQRLLAVLRPIRLTCGWGRWELHAPPGSAARHLPPAREPLVESARRRSLHGRRGREARELGAWGGPRGRGGRAARARGLGGRAAHAGGRRATPWS